MNRGALLIFVLAACHPRPDAPPPGATDTVGNGVVAVTEVSPPAPPGPAAAAEVSTWPLPPLVTAACDSAAATARRGLANAAPGALVRRQDSVALGAQIEGTSDLGCAVTIRGATADGKPGAPEYAFAHGPGGPGWEMSGRFAADGVGGSDYAVTRPGVLCTVEVGWYDPGDYPDDSLIPPDPPGSDTFDVKVTCVPDRGPPPPPPVIPPFQFERVIGLNVNGGKPCSHFARYTVVAIPLADPPFFDLLVRDAPEGHCEVDSLAGDLVLRHVAADVVSGIVGDALIIDLGPIDDGRRLRVIDIPSHRTVYEGTYLELHDQAPTGSIGLWQRILLAAPKPFCPAPPPNAPPASADSLRYIDLRTGQISSGHWESCPVHPRRR